MLLIAFKDCDTRIPVRFRTDISVFTLRAHTNTFTAVVRELLYCDDCALMAHMQEDAQCLFSHFQDAAGCFGVTVSLKRQKFSSSLQTISFASHNVSPRIAKASQSFGRLSKHPWDDYSIRLETKVAVYKVSILSCTDVTFENWSIVSYVLPLKNSTCEMAR